MDRQVLQIDRQALQIDRQAFQIDRQAQPIARQLSGSKLGGVGSWRDSNTVMKNKGKQERKSRAANHSRESFVRV